MLSLFDQIFPVKTREPEDLLLKQEFEVEVNGESVPVRIIYESRFNNRVTVNKNGILLRISEKQTLEERRKYVDQLLKWAKEKLGDKPELLESLPQRHYVNGEVFKVGAQEFIVSIFYHDGPKSTAKIFKNNVVLSIAKGLTKEAEANTCSYLVSKCLCKFYLPQVKERIHDINSRVFKKNLGTIKMKYATSFWGHCSHDGNLVISVRLMFAPQWVIDYVYIHELAHLVHHDHSPRFWSVVEKVMPNYKQAEKYLKDHSNQFYL